MITIVSIDPMDHPKGSAYIPTIVKMLKTWAEAMKKVKDTEETPAHEKAEYVAGEIMSMASTMESDMGSKSAFCPIYTLALIDDKTVGAVCKSARDAKPSSIQLIVALPKDLRKKWPKPSPVSVLMAEVAHRASALKKSVSLLAEVDSLIPIYEHYDFEKAGNEGIKVKMVLKDPKGLAKKYEQGKAWQYARKLPSPPK